MAGQGQLAREVRAGLTVIEGNKNAKKEVGKLDKLYYRKPIRQHVKEFGALFGAILLTIAAVQIYKGKEPLVPSLLIGLATVFVVLGYKAPALLQPLWSGWMKIAQILGSVMTILLLGIAWMLVLMPVSLIMRLVGKKVMDLQFKKGKVESYWKDRDPKLHNFKLLDKQF